MSTNQGEGLRVRGSCQDGHVTETVAAPKRMTWKGECAADGCSHPVTCKRIAPEPPADDTPPETPDKRRRVRKVTSYRADDTPPATFDAPRRGPDQRPGADAGVRTTDGAPGSGGAADEHPAAGGGPEPRPGYMERARARRAARRAAAEDRPWTIPGVYR